MTASRTTVTDTNRDTIVDRLMDRREAILHSVEALRGEAADAMENRDLSDLYDPETVADADVGATLTLATRAEQYLAKVDAAIVRAADGTYGLCLDCGAQIGQERLRVLPATSRCIRCSRKAGSVGRS